MGGEIKSRFYYLSDVWPWLDKTFPSSRLPFHNLWNAENKACSSHLKVLNDWVYVAVELNLKHAIKNVTDFAIEYPDYPCLDICFIQLQAAENEKVRWELEKTQLQQNIEENKERMLKLESYWIEAQTLCHTVNEHLKETQSQYQALEKKYNKAKKLIKDFQQK